MSTYKHKEAFCLMWYGCKQCGHKELFWNSRDGVTPFCLLCPSCNDATLYHIDFHRDHCHPNYVPHFGQRVWIDMTKEMAETYAKLRIATAKAHGYDIDESRISAIVADIYRDGTAPDVKIAGYSREVSS